MDGPFHVPHRLLIVYKYLKPCDAPAHSFESAGHSQFFFTISSAQKAICIVKTLCSIFGFQFAVLKSINIPSCKHLPVVKHQISNVFLFKLIYVTDIQILIVSLHKSAMAKMKFNLSSKSKSPFSSLIFYCSWVELIAKWVQFSGKSGVNNFRKNQGSVFLGISRLYVFSRQWEPDVFRKTCTTQIDIRSNCFQTSNTNNHVAHSSIHAVYNAFNVTPILFLYYTATGSLDDCCQYSTCHRCRPNTCWYFSSYIQHWPSDGFQFYTNPTVFIL